MPPLQKGIPLAPHTTLKVGGMAAYYAECDSEAELAALSEYAKAEGVALTILGGGSNVLVSEAGVSGIVAKLKLKGRHYVPAEGEVFLTAAAGEELDSVIAETVEKGYWGLENLSHIPGLVGATPIQNVGAYGVETSDVVEFVRVYDREREEFRSFSTDDCRFGYRDSRFKQEPGRYVVTAVTYRLAATPKPQLQYQGLQAAGLTTDSSLADIRAAVIAIRSKKFPDWRVVGTAGSFFKNPIVSSAEAAPLLAAYPDMPNYPAGEGMVKLSLGYILDKVCGLRGYQPDCVGLYQEQALVLVAYDGATAAAVHAFAREVASMVKEKTGLVIEREVTEIGD